MAESKKVLFISHDASRTGAPTVLLNFLRWLRTHTETPFEIVLKRGGELESEFRKLAPVSVVWRRPRSFLQAAFHPLKKRLRLQRLRRHLQTENLSLLYSNTVANGEILEALAPLKLPVITHVHELNYAIHLHGAQNFSRVRKYTRRFVAVSEAAKENLIETQGVSEKLIDVIYPFVAPNGYKASGPEERKHRLKHELGIPEEAFIVGACGTTDWRKAPDLFVQLASAVPHPPLERPVHFVWVGGDGQRKTFKRLRQQALAAGVGERIHFLGTCPNPLNYFVLFDVFALVSREDPFPLVMLEAASLGKPIVCFDGAGGAKEFVEDSCGFVVPYLDIKAMMSRIIDLLNSPGLRERLGEAAAHKVQSRHTLEVGGRQILRTIEKLQLV